MNLGRKSVVELGMILVRQYCEPVKNAVRHGVVAHRFYAPVFGAGAGAGAVSATVRDGITQELPDFVPSMFYQMDPPPARISHDALRTSPGYSSSAGRWLGRFPYNAKKAMQEPLSGLRDRPNGNLIGLYNAEISAGSLMLPESRRIARLLLTSPSPEQWLDALKLDNLLQKRTPATARRLAQLIRKRLETLEAEGLTLVATGSHEVTTQLLFAAAIKHSRIFADFVRDVYAGNLRRLEQNLSPAKEWEGFLAECVRRDPELAKLSDSTKAKVLQVIIRVLAEAHYLDSTSTLRLTPPHLNPEVVSYLERHGETSLLAIMDMTR